MPVLVVSEVRVWSSPSSKRTPDKGALVQAVEADSAGQPADLGVVVVV